jgi:NAD(P)-dependent dehydrogenase (short-subunit alcohol dehydrogenase family)
MKKVAIVTGGAMGYKDGGPSIGGEIAIRLAKSGYAVLVVDMLDAGKWTVEKIVKENKGEVLFMQGDVTDSDFVQTVVSKAKKEYGGLTCLVNCVARYGKGMAKSVTEITEVEWSLTLDVNLGAYFKCAKYAIPLILESGGGSIVNISSYASFASLPNFSVYSVAKAAIDGLTRSLAVDYAPQIRTNSVCPGFVKIANSQNDRSPEELKRWYAQIAKQYPMRRVCDVNEIASVVNFLVSDEASYINGQSIIVDGGKSVSDFHEF